MVRNMADMADLADQAGSVMTMLLASIASVSLIVGGIGIMNIMLVSVTERTREIGIRMAIGATERNVQSQFLTEAVVLSLIGGAIGISSLGWVASYLITQTLGWVVLISPLAIVTAVVFSMAVGIFFLALPRAESGAPEPDRGVALRVGHPLGKHGHSGHGSVERNRERNPAGGQREA